MLLHYVFCGRPPPAGNIARGWAPWILRADRWASSAGRIREQQQMLLRLAEGGRISGAPCCSHGERYARRERYEKRRKMGSMLLFLHSERMRRSETAEARANNRASSAGGQSERPGRREYGEAELRRRTLRLCPRAVYCLDKERRQAETGAARCNVRPCGNVRPCPPAGVAPRALVTMARRASARQCDQGEALPSAGGRGYARVGASAWS